MDEYYQLKQSLLMITLIITAFIFVSVWIVYSFNTALNYSLGACVGIVYLGMLAREVERIGARKKKCRFDSAGTISWRNHRCNSTATTASHPHFLRFFDL